MLNEFPTSEKRRKATTNCHQTERRHETNFPPDGTECISTHQRRAGRKGQKTESLVSEDEKGTRNASGNERLPSVR